MKINFEVSTDEFVQFMIIMGIALAIIFLSVNCHSILDTMSNKPPTTQTKP